MRDFEYAQPRTEAEALQLFLDKPDAVQLLAGGTDLIGLMKKMIVVPDRVVDISEVESMRQIEPNPRGGLSIGAAVHLDDILNSRRMDTYPAVKHVIHAMSSLQLQAQATIGGELFRRPACWYFRNGYGLLAGHGRMVIEGDNRYHAILGNQGPSKFVSASRLAPALMSLGARVRVIGPEPGDKRILPLDQLYRVPQREGQRETILLPNQIVTHILLPPYNAHLSAAYEVRHGEGPDPPLAVAAVTVEVVGGLVRQAKIVLGQVAPIPWVAIDAARTLLGRTLTESTAELAGLAAVAGATPLSGNGYKVQPTKVAVKRAISRAAGLDSGGLV